MPESVYLEFYTGLPSVVLLTGTSLSKPMFLQITVTVLLQDCFVTGKWAVGQDAEELLNLDKEDEEEVSVFASIP